MTNEKLKAVVSALRNEGMNSEEILQELEAFLKVSPSTLSAMKKAGMTSEEILEELTSEGETAPSVKVEPKQPKGSRKDIVFVKQYLREVVGIPTNIKGYRYIASAIVSYEDDMAMTKELYPKVAKEYRTTPSRVERAIRHAIETAWNQNIGVGERLGLYGSPNKGKPTNSELITTLVEILER